MDANDLALLHPVSVLLLLLEKKTYTRLLIIIVRVFLFLFLKSLQNNLCNSRSPSLIFMAGYKALYAMWMERAMFAGCALLGDVNEKLPS